MVTQTLYMNVLIAFREASFHSPKSLDKSKAQRFVIIINNGQAIEAATFGGNNTVALNP